jgi:hypothetical protein
MLCPGMPGPIRASPLFTPLPFHPSTPPSPIRTSGPSLLLYPPPPYHSAILFSNVLDPHPHWFWSAGSGSRWTKLTHKKENNEKLYWFEVLDVFFWVLQASPVTLTSFMEAQRLINFIFWYPKKWNFFRIVKFYISYHWSPDLKCWIRIQRFKKHLIRQLRFLFAFVFSVWSISCVLEPE